LFFQKLCGSKESLAIVNHREFLFHLERFGIKLGLENISYLLRSLGNPHEQLSVVHVGGTNGKGSVLAMLDSILRSAGYRVGRYTSPHLISLNERFLVNAECISDEELDEQIGEVRKIAERMNPLPTFFECATAVGFNWMAKKKVDVALVEVGMGGRFDATNVVSPIVSAITTIGLEHTKYLGDTLEKIAFEKAGIIKNGKPVVINERNPGPLNVMLGRAAELNSPVYLVDRDYRFEIQHDSMFHSFRYYGKKINVGPVRLGLAGAYQGDNAAACVAIVEQLLGHFPAVTLEAVRNGLSSARWPCRLEKVKENPPVIIDVAHNAHGALRLAEELERCVLVLAVSSDKAADQIIACLGQKTDELILTQFSGERSLPVDELCKAAGNHAYKRFADLREALRAGLELASDHKPLVITGSIFLAGEARKILIEEYGADPLKF